jgi:hypothetical protein
MTTDQMPAMRDLTVCVAHKGISWLPPAVRGSSSTGRTVMGRVLELGGRLAEGVRPGRRHCDQASDG